MTGNQPQSPADMLTAELAAVNGPLCGWTSVDLAPDFASCLRAAGHVGAQVMTDVHVCRDGGGQLLVASAGS